MKILRSHCRIGCIIKYQCRALACTSFLSSCHLIQLIPNPNDGKSEAAILLRRCIFLSVVGYSDYAKRNVVSGLVL
jgi:hypothetical protein